jgi:hypothetical protein
MKHDPSQTWSDVLALLGREEPYLQIGAIASLEMLTTDNKQLRRPTIQVLESALNQWESQESGPPADVKAAAQRLVASLVVEGREAGPRHWLRRLSGLRLSGKTT